MTDHIPNPEDLREPPEWTLARFNAATEAAFAEVCPSCRGTVRALDSAAGTFAFQLQHDRGCADFAE